MRKQFSKAVAAMLALLLVISLCPFAFAAGTPSPIVLSYKTSSSSISKNQHVNIEVRVKDTGVLADECYATDSTFNTLNVIDANHLIDSFSGGSVSIEVDPEIAGRDITATPLSYIVKFTDLVYSGSGQNLSFMVGYSGSYTTLNVSVTQAVPYVEPVYNDEPYVPEAIPEPTVLIHRGDIAKPVEAGQEFEVSITFENLSNVALTNPIVTYSPSDPIIVAGGSSSFSIEKIGAKKSVTHTVKLKAIGDIGSANLTLGVDLKYSYNNNVSNVNGSVSDRVNIPAVITKPEEKPEVVTVPEPPVLISRSPISPISAGQTFELEIAFKNAGEATIVSPVVSISTSEALVLQNDTSTIVLPEILPGEGCSITLKLKAANEIMSTTQSVSADLRYYYNNGSGLVQSSTSERMNISANVTESVQEKPQANSPVPNLIISEFGFGGDSVAAGEPFDLNFTFKNTGRLKVENIVVVVEGGESFTMNGSTNTFYYDSLSAGGELTQVIPMQTLAAARTGAQNVNISFRYEYVDNNIRSSSSSDIKLSVPVFQPDRLQIDEPTLYDMAYAGMETTIVMSYVNKGKSDMSNVEVSIAGDVDALQQTQYLGNFVSGQSGNISFVVTPWQVGETELLITVTYEDANLQTVTREFPLTLNVQEMNWGMDEPFYPDEPIDEGEGSKGLGIWLWVIIAVVLIAAAIITIAAVKRSKKKKATADAEADDDLDIWGGETRENAKVGSKEE